MRKFINPQLLVIDEMGHDRLSFPAYFTLCPLYHVSLQPISSVVIHPGTSGSLDHCYANVPIKMVQATANIKENCYRENTISKSIKASSFPLARITQ